MFAKCDWCGGHGVHGGAVVTECPKCCGTGQLWTEDVMEQFSEKWVRYFMTMAYLVAMNSKDERTRIGAVIVGPDKEVRSTGFKGLPRGCRDDKDDRQKAEKKYFYFEHAERNAVFHAARIGVSLKGCVMFTQGMPCADCARAIIQSGIESVYIHKQWNDKNTEKWQESCGHSLAMFSEAGVEVHEWDGELLRLEGRQHGETVDVYGGLRGGNKGWHPGIGPESLGMFSCTRCGEPTTVLRSTGGDKHLCPRCYAATHDPPRPPGPPEPPPKRVIKEGERPNTKPPSTSPRPQQRPKGEKGQSPIKASGILKYGGHCYGPMGEGIICKFWEVKGHACGLFGGFPTKSDSKALVVCDKVYGRDYEGPP